MQKKYTTIDIAKFMFCTCIVMLHTELVHNIWILRTFIFRIAVPFFFVASGYFFGYKIKQGHDFKETVIKYIKRLFVPYCFWLSINLALAAIKYYLLGKSIISIILYMGYTTLVYPVGALWYVYASMVGIYILYFFYIKVRLKLKQIFIVALLLYSFALLTNSYYRIVEHTHFQVIIDTYILLFKSGRNGVFVGFFFLFSGFAIATIEEKINKHINIRSLGGLCGVSFLCCFFEAYKAQGKTLVDEASLYIGFVILIPSLFIFLKRLTINIPQKISQTLRSLSVGVYFSHRAVYAIILLFQKTPPPPIVSFVIVYSICICICIYSYKTNAFLAKLLS